MRDLLDSLYKAINSGVENGRLASAAWALRKEAFGELLDVPDTAIAWKHLNKAVHDGEGEDPEIGLVRQIVAAVTKLSNSFGN